MKTTVLLLLCISVTLTACKKENEVVYLPDTEGEPLNYLTQFTGSYDGMSDHWWSSPSSTDSGYIFITNHDTQTVSVNVYLGILDSSLTLNVVYNQTTTVVNENLKFSAEGEHYSSWGGGSGYGYLLVRFTNDTLHYTYFQKCGIPCSSGKNFKIVRN